MSSQVKGIRSVDSASRVRSVAATMVRNACASIAMTVQRCQETQRRAWYFDAPAGSRDPHQDSEHAFFEVYYSAEPMSPQPINFLFGDRLHYDGIYVTDSVNNSFTNGVVAFRPFVLVLRVPSGMVAWRRSE
ncbi:MAG TPA: hypothetical protein VHH15_19100 [Actinophytocola sp.]|nr:hypothetical protein [Actinophytocola sp.]